MATPFTYFFTVRDHSVSPVVRITGLTPTWALLNAATSNNALTTSLATISEVGNGIYKVTYDVETNGEAVGQIDCGSSLSLTDDRYVDISLTAFIKTDLTQAVPNSAVSSRTTVGSGLLGADAAAFGAESMVGTQLLVYAADGVTVLRTFTLNNSTNPTQRT